MMKWHPISDPPKHDNYVLLWFPKNIPINDVDGDYELHFTYGYYDNGKWTTCIWNIDAEKEATHWCEIKGPK